MTAERLRRLLRAVAILAGVVWLYLAWRASTAPETWAQTNCRTIAFVVMVGAGMFSSRPRGDDETY